MTREGLTYSGFCFRNLGLFLSAVANTGRFDYSDPGDNPLLARLKRVPEWYAAEMFPHGRYLQNFNDSHWDPHMALWGFLMTFAPLRPALCRWVWDHLVGDGGSATYGQDLKSTKSSLFESLIWYQEDVDSLRVEELAPTFACREHGYVTTRTALIGQTDGFSFNAGRFVRGLHDQADNNSFTLFGNGVPLVIDSGPANDPLEGSASSSDGHNTVLIDGRGMLPGGRGQGTDASIMHLSESAHHLIVTGDATASYRARIETPEGRVPYNLVTHALRHCVYAADGYLVVYDDIRKDDEIHDYALTFHTPRPTVVDWLEPNHVRAGVEFDGRSSVLDIEVLHPRPVTSRVLSYESDEPQHPLARHTVWTFECRAINPHFLSVISWRSRPRAFIQELDDGFAMTVHMSDIADEVWVPKSDGSAGPASTPSAWRR